MSTKKKSRQAPNPDARSHSDHEHSNSDSPDLADSDVLTASSADSSGHSDNPSQVSTYQSDLPASVRDEIIVFCGDNGRPYLLSAGPWNSYVLLIGSKPANNLVRRLAYERGVRLKGRDIKDINDDLIAVAELSGDVREVWFRVARVQDGIEIDLGDADHRRIRITLGKVVIITVGSDTLFFRTRTMRALPLPAESGDLRLLDRYLNLKPASVVLVIAWISYTLAHPKVPTTSFPILVLQGDQGSGKTFLCQIIQRLIDPNVVGVQTFPQHEKDLAIAAEHAHVLLYDNMREIKPAMSDRLCTAATGGALTSRQLYTDADQAVLWLHVALVLNGIHSFIDQPDLAQRCLPLTLRPISEQKRRTESELVRQFQVDLPVIFRGLLDLIADVLTHLPTVRPTDPERMVDFVHWLAAMESVDGVPPGVYQRQYSAVLNASMLDSLLENSLAATVMSLVDQCVGGFWSGTPTALLQELNLLVGRRVQYTRDWPQNAIALSKQLRSLQASLRRQGIDVLLSRGHHRKVTITRMEGTSSD